MKWHYSTTPNGPYSNMYIKLTYSKGDVSYENAFIIGILYFWQTFFNFRKTKMKIQVTNK